MNKKALLITALAAAGVLAGGLALAEPRGRGPDGFGPPFMRGEGSWGPGWGMHWGRGAWSGRGPGMMMGRGMGPGFMGRGGPGWAFASSAAIAELKAELEIKAAQEPAWDKYTKALQEAAAAARTARDAVDYDALRKMTPEERFAFMTTQREQRWKQFEPVRAAAKELLAVLDETQKDDAEDVLPGLAFGPGSMGGFAMGGRHWYWRR
jgi:hypothetical protein